jgi:hypothetical protein
MQQRILAVVLHVVILTAAACRSAAPPAQPSTSATPASVVSIEAETGDGDGQIKQRSRASSGHTIHLGPGERRWWTFTVGAETTQYKLAVRYANGQEGEHETIGVTVDGTPTSSFENRDTGDSVEGWNTFVTDSAGTSTLRRGSHTAVLDVSGGDGCVEIDLVTLSPTDPGTI